MSEWHMNPAHDFNLIKALIKLNDELCSLERETGREYTLILVPETPDEKIHMSQSGKPLPNSSDISPEESGRISCDSDEKQAIVIGPIKNIVGVVQKRRLDLKDTRALKYEPFFI